MSERVIGGMGWRRDPPDFRDFSFDDHEVQGILRISSAYRSALESVLPVSTDLRKWCSRVRDQEATAMAPCFAVTGLIEYFDRRAFARHSSYSPRFLYRAARFSRGEQQGAGCELRTTLAALLQYGAPPETVWPFGGDADADPPGFCFGFNEPHRTMRYFRMDPPQSDGAEVLSNLRRCLAARLPFVFGLSLFSASPVIGDGESTISFPSPGESLLGTHAMMAVGYDDERMIGPHLGALLVRNSWSRQWGDGGYAWLPYKYVEEELACDFWSIVRPDFVNTDLFN